MSKIVAFHSHRYDAARSTITANLAALMAMRGQRVGVVDADLASSGIQGLFGLTAPDPGRSLNDYLWGRCRIEDIVSDVSGGLGADVKGKVLLISAGISAATITRILSKDREADLLNDGVRKLTDRLALDVLLLNTQPSLSQETLLLMSVADVLVIVMSLDQQDIQSTAVTVEVARRLDVPRVMLVLSRIPTDFDPADVQAQVEQTYGCEVAALLPLDEPLSSETAQADARVFVTRCPKHLLTARYREVLACLDV